MPDRFRARHQHLVDDRSGGQSAERLLFVDEIRAGGGDRALAKEVGPLGIKVSAVEPGAFRTDWAASSMKESWNPIEDYADNVGARKEMIKELADHLPGDPRKVGEAVLMVTALEDPPLRLLLGRDVLKAVRNKLTALASIDEWEAVTEDVNFPL